MDDAEASCPHQQPRAGDCTSVHRCAWAERADLVNALLADYQGRLSTRQLAARYPWARSTIARILAAHAVRTRTRSEACIRFDLDLAALHTRERAGESLVALAAEHGLSRQALSRRLRDYRRTLRWSA